MSARDLKIQRFGSDQAFVTLIGDHDEYSAERIARAVRALFDEGLDVMVDLRQATFVDSRTVGALIDAQRLAKKSGRRFTVLIGETTGWAVRRLFELTQLDSFLTVATV